jgi:hypothetical protein
VLEQRRFGDPSAVEPRQAPNEILVGALALLIALQSGLLSRTLIVQFGISRGAVDFMQAHEFRGNLLCDFSWGDYLIWRMAPASTGPIARRRWRWLRSTPSASISAPAWLFPAPGLRR